MVQDGIEQIRGVIVPIGFMVVRGILHFKSEPVGSKDLWDSFWDVENVFTDVAISGIRMVDILFTNVDSVDLENVLDVMGKIVFVIRHVKISTLER